MEFDPSRFAVIADIHGNADALEAVLADIDALGIACIVNLGDHLSGPLAPAETAEILARRPMLSIRGNHDRWLIEQAPDEMGPSDRHTTGLLEPSHLDWLRALPAQMRLSDRVFACHATPADDNTYWLEHVIADGSVVSRSQDDIAKLAGGIDARLFLCAHTHLPRRVDLPDGRTILNPGSVGCPGYTDRKPVPHVVQTGTPAASYAVVEARGEDWTSTHRHVPYDPARMVARARDAGFADWANLVGTGWISDGRAGRPDA